MTTKQKYLIKKAKELEQTAIRVQSRIKSIYDRTGRVEAEDVRMVTELHNKAVGMLEVAERVN